MRTPLTPKARPRSVGRAPDRTGQWPWLAAHFLGLSSPAQTDILFANQPHNYVRSVFQLLVHTSPLADVRPSINCKAGLPFKGIIMIVRTGSFTFPRARDIELQTQQQSFNFTQSVRQAVAILTGTSFGFSPRDDHHLGRVVFRLSTEIDDDVVRVSGTFGVRDWSGDVDDDYEGTIQFMLLTELETSTIASNLSITGVEFNQVIQFFRSQLDPATAEPDNSIDLIAGKNTALRVFVDTQSDPARPTIAQVSGTLEVRLPGESTWNALALLNGPIPPIQDSAIRRINANDTLNFFLPGAFCRGTVEFRVRAFDSAHANQPGFTSGLFQGTLRFAEREPLRIRGIAVRWTGATPAIAAPDLTALNNTLAFVVKGYPTSQVFISGFQTIDDDGNYASTSGGGCGPGWGGLLSQLREMQGDSEDVFYGLVPAAVPSGPLGCGGGDGRVAGSLTVTSLTDPVLQTAAQEIAHAFGREHACGGAPLDANYPTYDALPKASIGEVGIDDLGNVQDPALTLDFMAQAVCSTTRWVSPYTYEGLRNEFPPVAGSPDLRSLMMKKLDPESPRAQHLFLNFRIHRNGMVEIFPSFHYLSLPRVKEGRWTPYAIELRDAYNRVLQAQRIWLTDPYENLDSPGIDFYKPIPFPEETARVVITCGATGQCEQKELVAVDVPSDPPKVRIVEPKGGGELNGRVQVAWEAEYGDKPLRYLLRYSNDGGQTFRAVAPSLAEKAYVVNLDNLPGGDRCQFQVLATEGIRTGMGASKFLRVRKKKREVTIESESDRSVLTRGDILRLRGFAYSPQSGSASLSELLWYSNRDGAVGKGTEVHLRTLSPGLHKISLRAPDGLGGEAVKTISVRIMQPSRHKHTSRTHPNHTSKDHDTGKLPPYGKGRPQSKSKKSPRRK